MAAGGSDPVFLGITHLVFDLWGVAIALIATLLSLAAGLPPAMLLVRPPV